MLIDVETGRPYRVPREFVLERIDGLVEALGATRMSFKAWKRDLERRAGEYALAHVQCSCSYGTDLKLPCVPCPNPVARYVRIYKDSDVLSPMCEECAQQSWNIGD
jgi:hypothetical protein